MKQIRKEWADLSFFLTPPIFKNNLYQLILPLEWHGGTTKEIHRTSSRAARSWKTFCMFSAAPVQTKTHCKEEDSTANFTLDFWFLLVTPEQVWITELCNHKTNKLLCRIENVVTKIKLHRFTFNVTNKTNKSNLGTTGEDGMKISSLQSYTCFIFYHYSHWQSVHSESIQVYLL